MRYAVVVSYANGAGALLRTFSSDRQDAIDEINDLDADEFFEHVVKKHPAPQALLTRLILGTQRGDSAHRRNERFIVPVALGKGSWAVHRHAEHGCRVIFLIAFQR